MSKNVSNDDEAVNPFFLEGKALERHFERQDAMLEFHRLFNLDGQNDRASAIVGGAVLDTLLEHMLTNFLVDDEKEVAKLLDHEQPLGTMATGFEPSTALVSSTRRFAMISGS